MYIEEVLQSLTPVIGVSGVEDVAAQKAADLLGAFGSVKIDPMHNVIGDIPGEGPHILLDAHIDQIGMVVTGIDEKGFLKVAKCGGLDTRILLGHEVTVWAKEPLFGVISCQPPHLLNADSYKTAPDFETIAIDIGMGREKAGAWVRPGDRITLRKEQKQLLGSRICGPGFDDRAGVASILGCLDLLREQEHNCHITVLFSAQEEVGTRGAGVAAFDNIPEEAIAVDVSFAMTPDTPRHKCGDMGKGPMIGISPILNKTMYETMIRLAKEREIPYQLEVMGGETGTNADVISITGKGTKMGLVSIPLKYMHSSIEVIDTADVRQVARLLAAYIMEKGGVHHA